MDFDIPPENIHNEVPGNHFISDLSTEHGEQALRMKVFNEEEVLTEADLFNLIAQDLSIDCPFSTSWPSVKKSGNQRKLWRRLGFPT
jgi:hypothetical protein